MALFEYKTVSVNSVRVYLDGRRVGHINRTRSGLWRYEPEGTRAKGDELGTLAAVKRSIEGDDE